MVKSSSRRLLRLMRYRRRLGSTVEKCVPLTIPMLYICMPIGTAKVISIILILIFSGFISSITLPLCDDNHQNAKHESSSFEIHASHNNIYDVAGNTLSNSKSQPNVRKLLDIIYVAIGTAKVMSIILILIFSGFISSITLPF